MTTTPTGAVLLRVSTQRQSEDDRASYSVQRSDCHAAMARQGFADSGLEWQEVAKRDAFYTRDGLQAALAAAEQGKYQALFVWKLDRLTDDTEYFDRILRLFDQHGIHLFSATEPEIDLRTEIGRKLAKILIMFKIQPERGTTALRTKQARRHYTEQGRAFASNRAPYGYQWVVDPARTVRRGDVEIPLKERFQPSPVTAPIVMRMYEWVAAGRTLQWVARALSGLEEGGVYQTLTPRAASGMGGANPKGRWTDGVIAKMLKNPAYKGRYAAYRSKQVWRTDGSEKYAQEALPEEAWFYPEPSPAPALVTPELWQQAQARLIANQQYAARRAGPTHRVGPEQALLFRGMARCAVCGGPMAVASIALSYNKRGGYRYRCTRHARNMGTCPGVGWVAHAADLDRAVWAALVATLRQPDVLTRLARRSQAHDEAEAQQITVVTPLEMHRALQQKLAERERALGTLTARMENPALDAETVLGYEMRMRTVGAEVMTLRADTERAAREAAKYQRVEAAIGEWEDYLQLWRDNADLFSLRSYAPANKRALLEALGARVIVQPQGAEGPWAVLQLHLTALEGRAVATLPEAALEVPVIPVPQPAEPWREGVMPPVPTAHVAGGIYDDEMEPADGPIAAPSCRRKTSP